MISSFSAADQVREQIVNLALDEPTLSYRMSFMTGARRSA
jgi:hypothetical protein